MAISPFRLLHLPERMTAATSTHRRDQVCMQDESAAMRAIDIEFLMDALSRPSLHGQAQRIFAAGVACNALLDAQVRLGARARTVDPQTLKAVPRLFCAMFGLARSLPLSAKQC